MGSEKSPKRVYKREEYVWFFKEADKDKDGFLAYEELDHALRHFTYRGTDWDILRMFRETDLNRDAKVSFREYMYAMGQTIDDDEDDLDKVKVKRQSVTTMKVEHTEVHHMGSIIRSIFNKYDHDKSGFIDKLEMKKIFEEMGQAMTEDQVLSIMKQEGIRGEQLNFNEFSRIVMKDHKIEKKTEKTVTVVSD